LKPDACYSGPVPGSTFVTAPAPTPAPGYSDSVAGS